MSTSKTLTAKKLIRGGKINAMDIETLADSANSVPALGAQERMLDAAIAEVREQVEEHPMIDTIDIKEDLKFRLGMIYGLKLARALEPACSDKTDNTEK